LVVLFLVALLIHPVLSTLALTLSRRAHSRINAL